MARILELEFQIPSSLKYLSKIDAYVEHFIKLMDLEEECGNDICFKLNLALTEAVVNAIKHANKYDISKVVKVQMKLSSGKIIMTVRDFGGRYSIDEVKKPNPLADSGRGLYVIMNIMDQVDLRTVDSQNLLIMKKDISNLKSSCKAEKEERK